MGVIFYQGETLEQLAEQGKEITSLGKFNGRHYHLISAHDNHYVIRESEGMGGLDAPVRLEEIPLRTLKSYLEDNNRHMTEKMLEHEFRSKEFLSESPLIMLLNAFNSNQAKLLLNITRYEVTKEQILSTGESEELEKIIQESDGEKKNSISNWESVEIEWCNCINDSQEELINKILLRFADKINAEQEELLLFAGAFTEAQNSSPETSSSETLRV